jgi:hypothetical protein
MLPLSSSFPRAAAYASAHVTRRMKIHTHTFCKYACTKDPFADTLPIVFAQIALSHHLRSRVEPRPAAAGLAGDSACHLPR